MLDIRNFVDASFAENAYVVAPEVPGACWVIDPGLPPGIGELLSFLKTSSLHPEAILLTHAHADHIAGVDVVKQQYPKAKIHLAEAEHHFLTEPTENMSLLASVSLSVKSEIDSDLPPGMILTLGPTEWRVLDTAGHSPGGRSFYCQAEKTVFTGDALFAGSIGRTDLPHSSHVQLIDNIRNNLLALPDETVVFSGHGPTTTIGKERTCNPFLVE